MKKEKGYIIVVVLSILFFLSILAIGAFYIGNNDRKISYNVILQNKLFSAAENSISHSLYKMGLGGEDLLNILNIEGVKSIDYCFYNNDVNNSKCTTETFTVDNAFQSSSTTTLLNKECLSYGNTDQSVYCYSVEGTSNVVFYPKSKITNIQEIKIKIININNNGVYEF